MEQKIVNVFLASPRGFCAGVDRAVEIVKKTINKYAFYKYDCAAGPDPAGRAVHQEDGRFALRAVVRLQAAQAIHPQ